MSSGPKSSSATICFSSQVVEVALRQGLVHPMTAVPALVALAMDGHVATAQLAHQLLAAMYQK